MVRMRAITMEMKRTRVMNITMVTLLTGIMLAMMMTEGGINL